MNGLQSGFASSNQRREKPLQHLSSAMPTLQGSPRSISIGKAWRESGSLGDGYQDAALTLIREAGTVDLSGVFRHYGLELNAHTNSMCCPFPSHQDRSPSFTYYPGTNSFHCFGCKRSGGPVNLVSWLQNINKEEAAKLLLSSFESREVDASIFLKSKERESLHLIFSDLIRDFLKKHKTEDAFNLADKVCYVFDEANRKHSMDIDGLKLTIIKLRRVLNKYV